ncbi:MAG: hypothetical protein WC819_00595 [Parcubacteria group bacterium]|jgi:hypothetical protein
MNRFEGGIQDVAHKKVENGFDPDKTIRIEPMENDKDELSQQLRELENWKKGIIDVRDRRHSDDDTILKKIDEKIAQIKLEKEKRRIFNIIDNVGGAYSPPDDREISAEEMKKTIETVLITHMIDDDPRSSNYIPESPIYGTRKNLRDKVRELLDIAPKKPDIKKDFMI